VKIGVLSIRDIMLQTLDKKCNPYELQFGVALLPTLTVLFVSTARVCYKILSIVRSCSSVPGYKAGQVVMEAVDGMSAQVTFEKRVARLYDYSCTISHVRLCSISGNLGDRPDVRTYGFTG
jgi:hypothetical protein